MRSNFETEVRIQQCVELVKQEKTREALLYVRTHFGNNRKACKCCGRNTFTNWNGQSENHTGNLLHLMGLIALGPTSTRKEHQALLSDSRYDELIDLFRHENAQIYQLSSQSPFSACLQAGIAVHKTPNCKHKSNSRCIVCNDVYELSEGLPVTHSSNSRLFCAISGEPYDEDSNRPMMLPNGHVYGEKSIRKIAQNNEFVCPKTLDVCSLDDLQRLYVF